MNGQTFVRKPMARHCADRHECGMAERNLSGIAREQIERERAHDRNVHQVNDVEQVDRNHERRDQRTADSAATKDLRHGVSSSLISSP